MLQVVRHLELLEFQCFDGFSLDGTANAVLMTDSAICDAVNENPMGQCVLRDNCVVGGRSCGPHESCVDEHMNHSCDPFSDFQMEVVNKQKACGIIDACGPDACRIGNCVDKVTVARVIATKTVS